MCMHLKDDCIQNALIVNLSYKNQIKQNVTKTSLSTFQNNCQGRKFIHFEELQLFFKSNFSDFVLNGTKAYLYSAAVLNLF